MFLLAGLVVSFIFVISGAGYIVLYGYDALMGVAGTRSEQWHLFSDHAVASQQYTTKLHLGVDPGKMADFYVDFGSSYNYAPYEAGWSNIDPSDVNETHFTDILYYWTGSQKFVFTKSPSQWSISAQSLLKAFGALSVCEGYIFLQSLPPQCTRMDTFLEFENCDVRNVPVEHCTIPAVKISSPRSGNFTAPLQVSFSSLTHMLPMRFTSEDSITVHLPGGNTYTIDAHDAEFLTSPAVVLSAFLLKGNIDVSATEHKITVYATSENNTDATDIAFILSAIVVFVMLINVRFSNSSSISLIEVYLFSSTAVSIAGSTFFSLYPDPENPQFYLPVEIGVFADVSLYRGILWGYFVVSIAAGLLIAAVTFKPLYTKLDPSDQNSRITIPKPTALVFACMEIQFMAAVYVNTPARAGTPFKLLMGAVFGFAIAFIAGRDAYTAFSKKLSTSTMIAAGICAMYTVFASVAMVPPLLWASHTTIDSTTLLFSLALSLSLLGAGVIVSSSS